MLFSQIFTMFIQSQNKGPFSIEIRRMPPDLYSDFPSYEQLQIETNQVMLNEEYDVIRQSEQIEAELSRQTWGTANWKLKQLQLEYQHKHSYQSSGAKGSIYF